MTLSTRLHFGQTGQTYYPGRPYAPIVPPANIPTANKSSATMLGSPDTTTSKEAPSPGKPLHAHDYALAPIKAYQDERKDGRERRQGMEQGARQGASMISDMNRHQIGEQLNANAGMSPKPSLKELKLDEPPDGN